jgi:hypothetical protein
VRCALHLRSLLDQRLGLWWRDGRSTGARHFGWLEATPENSEWFPSAGFVKLENLGWLFMASWELWSMIRKRTKTTSEYKWD